MRVRVFLRQTLFTLPGENAHLPGNTAVIEGVSDDPTHQGLRIFAESFLDDKGRPLEGAPCDLILPGAKIDHVLVLR
jgi:hypothetical protein